MKKRNIFLVFLFSLITSGIYSFYWLYVTRKELNKVNTNQVPSIWLLLAVTAIDYTVAIIVSRLMPSNHALLFIPLIVTLITIIVVIYWYWKYAKAANEYTKGKVSTGLTFFFLLVFSPIGLAIAQSGYNYMIELSSPRDSTGDNAAPLISNPNSNGSAAPSKADSAEQTINTIKPKKVVADSIVSPPIIANSEASPNSNDLTVNELQPTTKQIVASEEKIPTNNKDEENPEDPQPPQIEINAG